MNRERVLRLRIKILTWIFILGLVFSGATAIPLQSELGLAAKCLGVTRKSPSEVPPGFTRWIIDVRNAVRDTKTKYPFLAYGTDWLAFAHLVIAVAFIGALRDPVRNIWLFTFGMIACAMVVPYAFIFGGLRGIPLGWRLIDCSFGVLGFIPLWLCRRWARELEKSNTARATR